MLSWRYLPVAYFLPIVYYKRNYSIIVESAIPLCKILFLYIKKAFQ